MEAAMLGRMNLRVTPLMVDRLVGMGYVVEDMSKNCPACDCGLWRWHLIHDGDIVESQRGASVTSSEAWDDAAFHGSYPSIEVHTTLAELEANTTNGAPMLKWLLRAVGITAFVAGLVLLLAGCGGGGDTGAEPERSGFPDVQIEPSRSTLCGEDGSLCK